MLTERSRGWKVLLMVRGASKAGGADAGGLSREGRSAQLIRVAVRL
jgi:hypothetical protein